MTAESARCAANDGTMIRFRHHLRNAEWRIDHDVLQGLEDRRLPEGEVVEIVCRQTDFNHGVSPLQMWQFMESHHSSVFVTSYETGIDRVKRGNYAFLMESTMLDYVVQVSKHFYEYSSFLFIFIRTSATAT